MKNRLAASKLETLTSPYGDWVKDEHSGIYVYHVASQHLLTQAAGYLKHVLASEGACNVYFRGQSEIYGTLTPTLYRGQTTQKQKSTRDNALKQYIKSSKNIILKGIDEHVKEPLLQHYGIKTRWLDVVDNIWVALWFACNAPIAKGKNGQYLCFQSRSAARISNPAQKYLPPHNKVNKYAYIYMIKLGAAPCAEKPGCFTGQGADLIDLRLAAPSICLRPHAQHGLLFTRSSHNDHKNTDYSDFVAGIIRVDLKNALAWLGSGNLLDTHSLFPPPIYDFGYMQLLDSAPDGNKLVGEIHVVCA